MDKLVVLVAGLALAASAGAAPVVAPPSFDAAGLATLQVPRAAAPLGRHAFAPAAGTVIYSTFNSDPDALYDCCVAYALGAAEGDLGFQQQVAMPFTPATDAVLKKVYVAISLDGGTDQMTGVLAEDAGGVPGRTIRQVLIENLLAPGVCCDTLSVPGKGTPLAAGRTYWIVAHPTGDTYAGWNYADTGVLGNVAYDGGDGWRAIVSVQGAFAVVGE